MGALLAAAPALAQCAMIVLKALFGTDKPVKVTSEEAKVLPLSPSELDAIKRLRDHRP
jgi:hypothetical protein